MPDPAAAGEGAVPRDTEASVDARARVESGRFRIAVLTGVGVLFLIEAVLYMAS